MVQKRFASVHWYSTSTQWHLTLEQCWSLIIFAPSRYKLGDMINVEMKTISSSQALYAVSSTVGQPTSYTTSVTYDGREVVNDEWLIVGNLAQIQSV